MTVVSNEICSICLDDIEHDDVLGISNTHCGHVFHTVCLQRHMGQAVIDSNVEDQECLITETHPGFRCPNCREPLDDMNDMNDMKTTSPPCGLWYSRPPTQVAFDALLCMYTQRHKSKRSDEKFRFVQTTAERARNNVRFVDVLKVQQEAQRTFSHVDRLNDTDVYRAYNRLRVTTTQMLELYLQSSGWSKELYRPLLDAQLTKYGLITSGGGTY